MNVYTVREFRGKVKEALNKAEAGEDVHIERKGIVYTLQRKDGVHAEECVHGVIKKAEDIEVKTLGAYGCGCKKEDKVFLCKKHGRY